MDTIRSLVPKMEAVFEARRQAGPRSDNRLEVDPSASYWLYTSRPNMHSERRAHLIEEHGIVQRALVNIGRRELLRDDSSTLHTAVRWRRRLRWPPPLSFSGLEHCRSRTMYRPGWSAPCCASRRSPVSDPTRGHSDPGASHTLPSSSCRRSKTSSDTRCRRLLPNTGI